MQNFFFQYFTSTLFYHQEKAKTRIKKTHAASHQPANVRFKSNQIFTMHPCTDLQVQESQSSFQ